ncbi:hypothetical protein PR048_027079 [Dryococelus australis]|uniref:Uncharacterized protein n=1 Tax=Dryococelus australis TaxID=614101 RepID=A0ABQ9GEG3_9NEOP|nr:hypothetical protein PR048_027079 [Dryococelus australis]
MDQRRNEGAGETGDPRENPPTNAIFWLDSRMRKSGSDPGRGLNPDRHGANARVEDTKDHRENPPISYIVRHDSHAR